MKRGGVGAGLCGAQAPDGGNLVAAIGRCSSTDWAGIGPEQLYVRRRVLEEGGGGAGTEPRVGLEGRLLLTQRRTVPWPQLVGTLRDTLLSP